MASAPPRRARLVGTLHRGWGTTTRWQIFVAEDFYERASVGNHSSRAWIGAARRLYRTEYMQCLPGATAGSERDINHLRRMNRRATPRRTVPLPECEGQSHASEARIHIIHIATASSPRLRRPPALQRSRGPDARRRRPQSRPVRLDRVQPFHVSGPAWRGGKTGVSTGHAAEGVSTHPSTHSAAPGTCRHMARRRWTKAARAAADSPPTPAARRTAPRSPGHCSRSTTMAASRPRLRRRLRTARPGCLGIQRTRTFFFWVELRPPPTCSMAAAMHSKYYRRQCRCIGCWVVAGELDRES